MDLITQARKEEISTFMKNREIKVYCIGDKKPLNVYRWICPICNKDINSFYPKELKFNVKAHILKCEKKEKDKKKREEKKK